MRSECVCTLSASGRDRHADRVEPIDRHIRRRGFFLRRRDLLSRGYSDEQIATALESAHAVAHVMEMQNRVARAWRDARVTKIWAGSNEIMKELIGRDLGF